MSLLNQMLRDIEHNKATAAPPFGQENAVHVSPSAIKKNINKVFLVGAFISSIAVFVTYLALSKEKQTTLLISQPLAIPELKTVSRQSVNGPKIKKAPIANKPKLLKVIANPIKPEPIRAAKPLKVKPSSRSSLNASTVINPQSTKNSIKAAPLSTAQQANILYQQASKTNNPQHAIRLLNQSIKLSPKQSNARLLLIRLFINTDNKQSAIELLDESLIIFPQNIAFIMARAQLYLQEKNTKSALQLLTKITTSSKNEAYLALLAAAYQQNKSYPQAREHYQTLVQLNSNKAEYWLGLALAQDALKQKEAAYNAYQKALKLHSLNSTINDYIQQRLKQLP
jgi:tetratricopeptide (TPR) repeat protein